MRPKYGPPVPGRLHRLHDPCADFVTFGCELCGAVFRGIPALALKSCWGWYTCPSCGQEIDEVQISRDPEDFAICMDVQR